MKCLKSEKLEKSLIHVFNRIICIGLTETGNKKNYFYQRTWSEKLANWTIEDSYQFSKPLRF